MTGSDPSLMFRGSSTYSIWVTMVMVLLPGSGVRTKVSEVPPFCNLNTRSTRSFSSKSTVALSKSVLPITAARYSTGVPDGVSAVISATYVVALKDAVKPVASIGKNMSL